jgi:hypothetical protein
MLHTYMYHAAHAETKTPTDAESIVSDVAMVGQRFFSQRCVDVCTAGQCYIPPPAELASPWITRNVSFLSGDRSL